MPTAGATISAAYTKLVSQPAAIGALNLFCRAGS
jgi:hypothetical protein